MSASFYDFMKYARTGIASPSMTHYDKQKALAMCGGGFPISTITGIPPLTFRADGTPLTAWSISGNMVQTGTPTPDAPITPQECGDLVESGEHAGQYAVPISCGGTTQTVYISEPIRKIGDYADTISSTGAVTRRIKELILTGTESWKTTGDGTSRYNRLKVGAFNTAFPAMAMCTHAIRVSITTSTTDIGCNVIDSQVSNASFVAFRLEDYMTLASFKQFLADQYAAGTPVTIWYVLQEPTIEQITVPTLTPEKGINTLSVGTTLQPSEVSITGHIKT